MKNNKPKMTFKIEMLGVKNVEELSKAQKASAIREFIKKKGATLRKAVRLGAADRANWYAYMSRRDKNGGKPLTVINGGKGKSMIHISGWSARIDEHGAMIFTRGNETLYGLHPDEYQTLTKLTTVVDNTKKKLVKERKKFNAAQKTASK